MIPSVNSLRKCCQFRSFEPRSRALGAASGPCRQKPSSVAPNRTTRKNPATPRRKSHASASGGVGDGRHPPLEPLAPSRERAPQQSEERSEGSAPEHAQDQI